MKYLDAVTLSWICILFSERIVPTNLYFPHLLYFKFMQKCMRKKCVCLFILVPPISVSLNANNPRG